MTTLESFAIPLFAAIVWYMMLLSCMAVDWFEEWREQRKK